jgi:hypothetical protein
MRTGMRCAKRTQVKDRVDRGEPLLGDISATLRKYREVKIGLTAGEPLLVGLGVRDVDAAGDADDMPRTIRL